MKQKKKRNKPYKPMTNEHRELALNKLKNICNMDKHRFMDDLTLYLFEKRVVKLHQNLEQGTANRVDMMYMHGICASVGIAIQNSDDLVDEMDAYELILNIKATLLNMINRQNDALHPFIGYQNEIEEQAVAKLYNIAKKLFKRTTQGQYDTIINLLHEKCIKDNVTLIDERV